MERRVIAAILIVNILTMIRATTEVTEITTPEVTEITTPEVTKITTPEVTEITTPETTAATTEAMFVCSAYGRYEITTSKTCQSYYFCYPNADGTFKLYEFFCPTTTVFNPATAKCVLPTAYTCKNKTQKNVR